MSHNPVIKAISVQPSSKVVFAQFEKFLKDNVDYVVSMLSDSTDTDTFVKDSVVFLRMETRNSGEDQLTIQLTDDTYAMRYCEHIGATDDEDSHFEAYGIASYGKKDLYHLLAQYMTRWLAA